jgi:hypothetical protein
LATRLSRGLRGRADVEKNEFSRRRPKKDKRAIAQLLTALKKAQTVKGRPLLLEAREFENVCNLQAGVAFCERREAEQEKHLRDNVVPLLNRRFDAVQTAYHLVQLVVRRGIYDADKLSQKAPL